MSWGKHSKLQNFCGSNRKKIRKFDEDSNKSVETIYYKIKFINSERFMASSLSNLVDNLAKRIHKIR